MFDKLLSMRGVAISSAFVVALNRLCSTATSSSPGLVVGEAGVGSGVFEDPGPFVEAGEDCGSAVVAIGSRTSGLLSLLRSLDLSLYWEDDLSSLSTPGDSNPFTSFSSIDDTFRVLGTSDVVCSVSEFFWILGVRAGESLDASSMSMEFAALRDGSWLACLDGLPSLGFSFALLFNASPLDQSLSSTERPSSFFSSTLAEDLAEAGSSASGPWEPWRLRGETQDSRVACWLFSSLGGFWDVWVDWFLGGKRVTRGRDGRVFSLNRRPLRISGN
jgi:hypothetical protein